MARIATRLLIALVRAGLAGNGDTPRSAQLPFRLIARESDAAPRGLPKVYWRGSN